MTNTQLQYWNLQELKRANKAKEAENYRSNFARENETNRHNVATEGIDLSQLQESHRHNLASEAQEQRRLDISALQQQETARSNRAQEYLKGYDLNIASGNLSEAIRHNLAQEDYLSKANYARAALDNSQATLNEIDGEFRRLQNLNAVNKGSNEAKVVEQQLKKMKMEISKMKSDIDRNSIQNVQGWFHIFNDAADTAVQALRVIGGN